MNKKNNKLAKKIKNKLIKSKTDEKISKMKNNLNIHNVIPTKKLKIALMISFFAFIFLICRLFYLQIIDGSHLSSLATRQQTTSSEISSKRGNIYDSTGASLAISETVDTISINPSKIKGKTDEKTAELKQKITKGLSEIFELNYDELLEKVNNSSSTIVIAKKVEEDVVNKLKNWMKENKITAGINIDDDTKRYYPYGSLASQIIGSCGTDNQGLAGIEYSYDSILKGTSGEIVTSRDASKSEIPNSQQSFIEAENGYNLTLTLDVNIQSIVERHLKQAVDDNSCSKGGNCIVMNPQTGDILAMASYPDYDLNNPRVPTSYYADNWDSLSNQERFDRIQQMWKIRSVSETYEPGSVFKLITSAVALEENITKTDTQNDFYCNGFEDISGTIIQCWKYQAPYYTTHQSETLREALMNSCNPAFMQLAKRIGAPTLYKYYNAFGFFNKTLSGLPGESSSIFYDLDKVHPVELATMSFGQRFTITPLQMCTALCSIANNGYLLQPKIVKSMTNTDTGEVTTFETTKVRQVISSKTSNELKSMMQSVVTDGTGKNAQVQGYSIGGKSGTSEPIAADLNAGYTTSFAAISPIENTQVVILVTLYDPKGDSHQGGQTAAPVVSKILSEVLPYMGIEPDQK
jgi:stage V sporulation protein D (sporulation-specific penicillin-binding protein)